MIDSWQYFLHRALHMNTYLYKTFHAQHHRLYVPYAYGTLYNHPVEGFLMDTLGALVAERAAQLTMREATLLFVVATAKAVNVHCGYNLPWDPLQIFTANNADYHDIHHQVRVYTREALLVGAIADAAFDRPSASSPTSRSRSSSTGTRSSARTCRERTSSAASRSRRRSSARSSRRPWALARRCVPPTIILTHSLYRVPYCLRRSLICFVSKLSLY